MHKLRIKSIFAPTSIHDVCHPFHSIMIYLFLSQTLLLPPDRQNDRHKTVNRMRGKNVMSERYQLTSYCYVTFCYN